MDRIAIVLHVSDHSCALMLPRSPRGNSSDLKAFRFYSKLRFSFLQ